MPFFLWGVISGVGSLIGKGVSAIVKSKGAKKAAKQQVSAVDQAIGEQRKQLDRVSELLSPFVGSGVSANQEIGDLLGLGRVEKGYGDNERFVSGDILQKQAIDAIENSALFRSITDQGEQAILRNAAATGGLRGGNTQLALSQYRPQILNSLIQQRLGNLDRLRTTGFMGTQSLADSAMRTGSNISNLFNKQGEARAQGTLAQYGAFADFANQIGNMGGNLFGRFAASEMGS